MGKVFCKEKQPSRTAGASELEEIEARRILGLAGEVKPEEPEEPEAPVEPEALVERYVFSIFFQTFGVWY